MNKAVNSNNSMKSFSQHSRNHPKIKKISLPLSGNKEVFSLKEKIAKSCIVILKEKKKSV